ncbi:MAG TPA: hypothetical protein VHS81_03700 [Caulobacteraceae bacterium]|jgi:hypothetical protein|nr:hypothetical protein [Caulobacteraceae bacterium]
MSALVDDSIALFAFSLLLQWVAAFAGRLARRARPTREPEREQVLTVLEASLTLLALLIGFSLAMAVAHYDQRENAEEAEASAIGVAYLRADLLPAPAAAQVHALLVSYAGQRVLHYEMRGPGDLSRIDAVTARLEEALWNTVTSTARAQPTPTMALVTADMTDVLRARQNARAAEWSRIPSEVWFLLLTVATACNILLGRVESRVSWATLLLLPLILSVSFFLIADIDSPRVGIIRVGPQNLIAGLRALPPRPPPPAASKS